MFQGRFYMRATRRGLAWLLLISLPNLAADRVANDDPLGTQMLAGYFRIETDKLATECLTNVDSLSEWESRKDAYREQLQQMLGLWPWPQKTPLRSVVTGKFEHDDIVVERLHFQSQPDLYVTGNLYRPKFMESKLPAILYVCGHGAVKRDGVSYGNKVHYHHHGAWFARNGYVCLTIDSLQLGEIEGIHHGTHRYDRWWWLNRGYTPAGVEAWNCVRALDYLESRSEVDPARIGVTGRSGGGAYSWWIAAIDDRIKVAVPVAGITDLQNHVVDGCVTGHCDCMYMVNTYRWDYPLLAALVAPRPLLISNTDRDGIFPLDGVFRTFEKVRRIYNLYGERDSVALHITAGPHKDTQELRVHAFRWLNQHLKKDDGLIEDTAVKLFAPEQLKVFDELPEDQINTSIDEHFVPAISQVGLPADAGEWEQQRERWMSQLVGRTFRGWPTTESPLEVKEVFDVSRDNLVFRAFDFTSQVPFRLRLYLLHRADVRSPDLTVLNVLNDVRWRQFLAQARVLFEKQLIDESLPVADEPGFVTLAKMLNQHNWCMSYVAPRGIGRTSWDRDQKIRTQVRRRFYLLGQTLDTMRIYDVRRAIKTLGTLDATAKSKLWLQSQEHMAGITLYAALFEPDITRLDLYALPHSHRNGPILLNISQTLDLPQVVAMVAEQSQVVLYGNSSNWKYPQDVARTLSWSQKQLHFRAQPQ